MRLAILAALVAATAVPAAQPTDAKQQVLELEKEWITAENKHDAASLRRILDDKALASFGGNKPYDESAFIKEETDGELGPTASQILTDQTVIIDHDTAVVVGTDTAGGTENGAAYKEVLRYTATYIRRDGRWLALARHIVHVPKAR